jgi:hypothetical protein
MKYWIALTVMLLLPIFAHAQSNCADNLTKDECEFYQTAMNDFLSGGDYTYRTQFSVSANHGATDSRSVDLSGTGFLTLNEDATIDTFFYESTLFSKAGNSFDWENSRRIYNQYWQFAYQDGIIHLNPEERGWQWTIAETDDLPLQSILPILPASVQIERMVTEISTNNGEESLLYLFSYDSDFIADTPFAIWQRLIMGQDLTDISGMGTYSGVIAINPETGVLQGIQFESSDTLESESFGQIPVTLSVRYVVQFQRRELPLGDLPVPPAHAEFNSEGAYAELGETGYLGLLSTALSEHLVEIFPPMGE